MSPRVNDIELPQPDVFSPHGSLRKVSQMKKKAAKKRVTSDLQAAALPIKLGHSARIDLAAPPETVRKIGTLKICTSEANLP